jgi:hypothetical protein
MTREKFWALSAVAFNRRNTMRLAAALLIGLLVVPAIADQPKSSADAQAELDRKQIERELAATQPANITNAELATLRAEITRLRAENLRLKSELQSLKGNSQTRQQPKSTFTERTKEFIKNGELIVRGSKSSHVAFAKKNADEWINHASKIDEEVKAYLGSHNVSDDIEDALWEGRPAIGMEREALMIFGELQVREEMAHSQIVAFSPWNPGYQTYSHIFLITLDGDIAISISY